VPLNFRAERGDFDAELVLDALPAAGKRLWVQPVVTRGAGGPIWLNILPFNVDPPVEPKPMMLVLKPQPGSVQPLHLKTAGRLVFESGAKTMAMVQNTETHLSEKTTTVNPAGANVTLTVDKVALFGEHGEPLILSDQWRQATTTDLDKLVMSLVIDTRGIAMRKQTDVTKAPAETRDVLKELAERVEQAIDLVAMPLPSSEMQPGQTWQARRPIPTGFANVRALGNMEITYTFLGTRQHRGREVGVVQMKGTLVRDNRESEFHVVGRSLYDPKLNLVVQANVKADLTAPVKLDGSSFLASGTLEVRLTRGPDVEK
jgi:hypothetical protein